jgi:Mg2+-importing ATPase
LDSATVPQNATPIAVANPKALEAAVGGAAADKFWNQPLPTLLQQLASGQDGLSGQEAAARLQLYGANTAADVHRNPWWWQLLGRFRNPLILLLLAASALSALTGDVASFAIVTTILIFSIALDFYQEVQANNTVDALRQSVALKALVIRDGQWVERLVRDLVPGDVVQLSPGKLVPADGRLMASKDLYVNQSLLTGESFPAEKHSPDLPQAVQNLDEAVNAVFMGTSVISGSAQMVVVATGQTSQLGHLAGQLASRHTPTNFERGVERFGLMLLRVAIVMVLFVLLINVSFDRPMLESFLFALALAVGLAPELLPMIVTITLARGARRMAANKVIVKHLPAMHNLGAMDVLCTDKTGTLTAAEIRLEKALDTSGQPSLAVLTLAYLNSHFESGAKTPLDQAILDQTVVDKGQLDMAGWQRIDEVPFDFERRRLSVLVASASQRLLIVKGAPEDILQCSSQYEAAADATAGVGLGLTAATAVPLDAKARQRFMAQFNALGAQGFRVLGIAYRAVAADQTTAHVTDESELIFAGFAVFLDPPKMDAAATLKELASDGIQVKIISGDNELVMRHVCGLLNFDVGRIITGDELAQMNDEALFAAVDKAQAFCRVTPQQKSRIIATLQRRGHTVGFLGDGINDAPALHMADVGISVDGATDVAKEAADIILLEHDLSVIHGGVLEGRRAVLNTEKYILMGASSTFGNMVSMAGAALLVPFLPMLPIQVLLNDLLYDLSQTAVPFDRVDPEALAKPVHWDIGRVKRFMWVFGPASSLFDFLTFYVLLRLFDGAEASFQTGWFMESMVTQTLIIFAIRTRKPLFRSAPHPLLLVTAFSIAAIALILPITAVGGWFGLVPLPASFLAFLAVAVLAYFLLVEGLKHLFRRALR